MSIRAAISGLLAGDRELSDPAAALEDAGYDNIPAEVFGTALTHFSDTATLDEADALAPVVTRTGPIAFEEPDLPELNLDVQSNDAFTLFGHTVTTVHQDFGEFDLDESVEIDDLDEDSATIDDRDSLAAADDADFEFGESSLDPEVEDSPDDDPFDDHSAVQPGQSSVLADTESQLTPHEERESDSTEVEERLTDDDSDDTFGDEVDFDL